MTDAEFHGAIRRIRRLHWLHYPVQASVMTGLVLGGARRSAVGTALEPRLATWPALLLLVLLVPLLGGLLYRVYRRMRPNLRRPAEQNLRIYQSRIFLRNSLMSLLGLPLLVSYVFTRNAWELAACGGVWLALTYQLMPSAKTYQRWLIS